MGVMIIRCASILHIWLKLMGNAKMGNLSQYDHDRIVNSTKEAISTGNVDYIVSIGARIKNSEDGVCTEYIVIPKSCHDKIRDIIKFNGEKK